MGGVWGFSISFTSKVTFLSFSACFNANNNSSFVFTNSACKVCICSFFDVNSPS